ARSGVRGRGTGGTRLGPRGPAPRVGTPPGPDRVVRPRRGVRGAGGSGQVLLHLGRRLVAVGLREAVHEVGAAQLVLLGADGLDDQGGEHAADLGGALQGDVPGQAGQEARAEGVADAGRVRLALLGRAADLHGLLAGPLAAAAARAAGGDAVADPVEDLGVAPAGLALDEPLLVLVGEEVGRPVQQYPDLLTAHPGDLLGEVGGERDLTGPALLGVAEHALGVVRADEDQVET